MTARGTRRFDLAWRRAHLPGMLLVLAVVGTGLCTRAASRTLEFGRSAPVILSRIARAEEKIDPNTGSEASLRRLPGIGPVKARAIVEYRESTDGLAFTTADDLTRVHGIGPGIVRNVRRHIDLPDDDGM